MIDLERRFLEVLHESRPAYDEKPDWRAVLSLYVELDPATATELDQLVVRMIDEEYRNPYPSRAALPFDEVMTGLPAGMTPDDLLCMEAAVLVAAERRLGEAFFAFNRLMRSPRWHAMYPRLQWLGQEAMNAQRNLADTTAGRYMGALLGLAVGDALGVTVEFMSRRQLRQAYPDGHREMIGGGPFGFKAGEWSDDTAMALAVARGITESPDDPVDAVGRHFMDWYGSNPPDVGNTCRLALETFQRTSSWAEASATVVRELGDRAGGNGALMRTLPAALAYGGDTAQAIRIAQMTHPHAESDAAVAIYHRVLDAILRQGADKEDALEMGLAEAGPLTERLSRLGDLTEDDIRSTGYVVDTLEAALWCLLRTESLEACLVAAVNLGDDADTLGAVAGGLAGALYGPLAVPRRWSLVMKNRDQLEDAAEKLYAVALR